MANTFKNNEELKQTNKRVYLVGRVSGTKAEDFFVESTTKTGKKMRTIKFAINTSETNRIYCEVRGFEQATVYFKKGSQKDHTYQDKKVAWADRAKAREEGYSSFNDINIGLERGIGIDGKESNLIQYLLPYDACLAIKNLLKDDTLVYVRATRELSTFSNKEGIQKVSTKIVPDQISLCKNPVEILPEDQVDYSVTKNIPNRFEDTIIYKELTIDNKENPSDPFSATLTAVHIGYEDICEHEYKVYNQGLARTIKSNLKPYSSLKVVGKVLNNCITNESESEPTESAWGIATTTQIKNYQREYVILGCDPETIDTESYSAAAIEKAKISSMEFKTTNTKADFVPASANEVNEEELWG